MRCANCGTKLARGAEFCHKCATPAVRVEPAPEIIKEKKPRKPLSGKQRIILLAVSVLLVLGVAAAIAIPAVVRAVHRQQNLTVFTGEEKFKLGETYKISELKKEYGELISESEGVVLLEFNTNKDAVTLQFLEKKSGSLVLAGATIKKSEQSGSKSMDEEPSIAGIHVGDSLEEVLKLHPDMVFYSDFTNRSVGRSRYFYLDPDGNPIPANEMVEFRGEANSESGKSERSGDRPYAYRVNVALTEDMEVLFVSVSALF